MWFEARAGGRIVSGCSSANATLLCLLLHPLASPTIFGCVGVMDNFVMLAAGDLIDNTLGVKFGLATLTAAACGQVVSKSSLPPLLW